MNHIVNRGLTGLQKSVDHFTVLSIVHVHGAEHLEALSAVPPVLLVLPNGTGHAKGQVARQ